MTQTTSAVGSSPSNAAKRQQAMGVKLDLPPAPTNRIPEQKTRGRRAPSSDLDLAAAAISHPEDRELLGPWRPTHERYLRWREREVEMCAALRRLRPALKPLETLFSPTIWGLASVRLSAPPLGVAVPTAPS